MDLGRVQAKRFDHGAMDGRMIGLGMGQRQPMYSSSAKPRTPETSMASSLTILASA